MRRIAHFRRVLSDSEFERLCGFSLELLADPGMGLENPPMLRVLEGKGATVGHQAEIVRFSRQLAKEAVAQVRAEDRERRHAPAAASPTAAGPATRRTISSETTYPGQVTHSWHTPFHVRLPPVEANFVGLFLNTEDIAASFRDCR